MTDITLPFAPIEEVGQGSYLDEGHTLASWLTTTDHKRIAILYAISITVFFFIGGIAIGLVRLELIEPRGMLLTSDAYNRLFTIHGIIMVWFFLVPSIPATMGNFLLPMMIGASDVAFPRLNLLSWYLYVIAAAFTIYVLVSGGVDTGWTFYPPFSSNYSNGHVVAAAAGVFAVLDAVLDHDQHSRRASFRRHRRGHRRGGSVLSPHRPGAGLDHGGCRYLLALRRFGVAGALSPALSGGPVMSERSTRDGRHDGRYREGSGAAIRRLAAGPALVWLILLGLLVASCWSAFLPLGPYNTVLNLVLAAIMLLVLATFLMNLAQASALLRLVASAGLLWVVFLFVLTFADYLSRRPY
jgi:caa(3)-type oxidase subunit IV